MIPKTEIRYSIVYNKMFNKDFSRKDLIKLRENCKKFEKLYNKYINKILKLIEKYHKKQWTYKVIPIYIVKDVQVSFSDPLTLKYYDNEKSMLVLLTHELLHNNFTGKWHFKNSKELHKYMEPIVNKVVRGLPINLEKELKIMNKRTTELAKKNSR